MPGLDRLAKTLTRVSMPAQDRRLSADTGLAPEHWAVAGAGPAHLGIGRSKRGVTVAAVDSDPLASQLVGAHGWSGAGTSIAPYGTAFGEWAVVPELHGAASDGLYVALASLTAVPDPADLVDLADVEVAGSTVVIRWRGTAEPTRIDLDAMPWG